MRAYLSNLFCLLMITGLSILAACGGSEGGGGDSGETFSTSASRSLTTDVVGNSSTSCDAASPSAIKESVTVSEGADHYFGRIGVLDSDGFLYSGVVKFVLCESSTSGYLYFADFSLEHFSAVSDINTKIDQVTSSTDLEVTEVLDDSISSSTTNYFYIPSSSSPFAIFEVDFGNTSAFGSLISSLVTGASGGLVFSSDLTTMAGGDNSSFIFIAQKVEEDNLDSVSTGDVSGDWDTFNFTVSSSGSISTHSTSEVNIGSFDSDNEATLTGINSSAGSFDGIIGLNDTLSGGLAYRYTESSSSTIDGALIASPDKEFALGYDFTNGFYFAAY